ncbi:helix-turn-helix domain-containing protein [Streptomyces sp. SID13588]|nr:helix-turn-helix domain-containing protein [Streptomyces sp. SID13588]
MLDGSSITEVALRYRVSRQSVYTWKAKYAAGGIEGLREASRRPKTSPTGLPAVERVGDLPAHQALEVDRTVDANGWIIFDRQRVKIGAELANKRITVRLDGQLLHAVHDGARVKTLPSPFTADERPKVLGARAAATQLPPLPAAVSVERKVPRDGVVMVARQRLRVGRTYTNRIVTIYVEDTHFRVTYEGAELSLHARKDDHPVKRWKAKIHTPRLWPGQKLARRASRGALG